MMRLTSFGHAAILVESDSQRILVDPWLTQRLDRFWERHPPLPDGLVKILDGGLDHIIFSHHHFDHHHFPSLAEIVYNGEVDFDDNPSRAAEINCIFPAGPVPPQFTASGLGHQAMQWTLRRLGFEKLTPVTPGDTIQIGDVTLRTFPSNVPFPEMSLLLQTSDGAVMLCGDSILHDSTVEFFDRRDAPPISVAFVPVHSVSLPGVLTERRKLNDVARVKALAMGNFERHVTTLGAELTVPSSFGWKVRGDGNGDFSWCNQAIFPITPWDALVRLRELGRQGLLCGPGQTLELTDGTIAVSKNSAMPEGYDFESIYAEVSLNPELDVPQFDPARDRYGQQTRHVEQLVGELMHRVVGTDFWYRALDSGACHTISVYGDDDTTSAYLLETISGRAVYLGPGAARSHMTQGGGYTEIAASTLQALLDTELLFGSSYGLWVSNSNMLSAVFHHPSYYTRHVDRKLGSANGPNVDNDLRCGADQRD